MGTITYRSGPEWLERFGRDKISNEQPSLCPYFEIESYLEYKGEQFSVKYDPNSLLYISKVRKSLSALPNYDFHSVHATAYAESVL